MMHLRILAPSRVVVDQPAKKIVAEAEDGSFCLLPRHVDRLAALVPGLLLFVDQDDRELAVAVDEGILVKRAREVLVSTRQAVLGDDLSALRATVREEFSRQSDKEVAAHAAAATLEASFLRRYLQLAEELR